MSRYNLKSHHRSVSAHFYKPGNDGAFQSEPSVNPDKASNTDKQLGRLSQIEITSEPRPISNSIITTEVELEQTFPLGISYLHSALFATVLEDTLIKLKILVESGTQILINNIMQNMDEKWAAKFAVEPGPVRDELSGVTHKNMDCDEFKLIKLDKDRTFFGEVIGSTYLDLALRLTFNSLNKYILGMQEVTNYQELILEEELRNKAVVKDLRKQLRLQRVQNKSLAYDVMVELDMLEKKIEDAEITEETGTRQVDNWERARKEQTLEKIRQTEDHYEDTITMFKEKQEQEQRVHAEIETFVTISTRDRMDQVEFWMTKYEQDLEQMDLKLQIKRNYYLSMLEKREGIEQTIEQHEKSMETWILMKTTRSIEGEYKQKLIQSAIIVQAWWRGLLVRKQLGPYRPSKRRRMSLKSKKLLKKT